MRSRHPTQELDHVRVGRIKIQDKELRLDLASDSFGLA